MGELLTAVFVGIAKAINAPAEDRAKLIADEIAQHSGALDALAALIAQGPAYLDEKGAEIARLKAAHDAKDAEIARLSALLAGPAPK